MQWTKIKPKLIFTHIIVFSSILEKYIYTVHLFLFFVLPFATQVLQKAKKNQRVLTSPIAKNYEYQFIFF